MTCLKVIGMTLLAVLAVISIKDTAEKEVVQTERRSQRSNIRNHTSSQSSNSSQLPKSSSLDIDSLAGNRIHGVPNRTQPRFDYLQNKSIYN